MWLEGTCVVRIEHFFQRFILSSLFVMSVLLSSYPISKEHISLHFSLPENLSFKIVASKCLFLSLRVKFERYSVFTFILGRAAFNLVKFFLCYFFF